MAKGHIYLASTEPKPNFLLSLAVVISFAVALTERDIGSLWVMLLLFSCSAAHSSGRLTGAAPAGLGQNSKQLIFELT